MKNKVDMIGEIARGSIMGSIIGMGTTAVATYTPVLLQKLGYNETISNVVGFSASMYFNIVLSLNISELLKQSSTDNAPDEAAFFIAALFSVTTAATIGVGVSMCSKYLLKNRFFNQGLEQHIDLENPITAQDTQIKSIYVPIDEANSALNNV